MLAAHLYLQEQIDSFSDVTEARLIPSTDSDGDVWYYLCIHADVPDGVVPHSVLKVAALSSLHLLVEDTGADDDGDTVIELR
jgi:hypothetical protein